MNHIPGEVWLDDDGAPIQAHGGGVLYDDGVYYWYGENKDTANVAGRDGVDFLGVSCYASRDLRRWKHHGLVLPARPEDPAHDLHPSRVVERPKALRCPSTGKYVLWAHVDDAVYGYARVGVAVGDSPTGPFQYVHSFRPNGHESRDMTVFADRDGSAYLFHSSDGNRTLRIARMADDYLGVTDTSATAFEGQSREAPAVFARDGVYYLLSSGCTGWLPTIRRSGHTRRPPWGGGRSAVTRAWARGRTPHSAHRSRPSCPSPARMSSFPCSTAGTPGACENRAMPSSPWNGRATAPSSGGGPRGT